MKQISKIVTKGIIIILITILTIILLDTLFFYTPIVYTFNPILLMIAIILYTLIVMYIYQKIVPKIKNNQYVPYILIAIFGILCLTISYLTRLQPNWDMGDIYHFASDYVMKGINIGRNAYLYQYPHNLMITLIYTGVMKVASLLPLTEYVSILTVFNSIIATLMVVMMYKIVQKLYGQEKAIMLLILLIFTTPIYFHTSIYYTDLMSAFFAVCIFYIYIRVDEERKYRKSVFYQILLGIVLFLGIKIKMTVLIMFIAILMEQILIGNMKNIFLHYVIPTTLCIIVSIIFSNVIEPQILYIRDAYVEKIPIEHWIMMGLKGNGGYQEEDLKYTCSFDTYQEKKKANQEEIRKRIEEYNLGTFLIHLNEKIKYTWTDGTYFSIAKIRCGVLQENVLNQTIIQDTAIYKYLPQTMHVTMIGLILIYACSAIKKGKLENSKDKTLILSIIGIFFFLLLWEDRSRYIFTMLPFLLILQLNGLDILVKRKMLMNKKRQTE